MKNNERLFEAIFEQREPIADPSRQRVPFDLSIFY